MDGPIPTPTDPVLTLAQWLSPGFPVGAFAYSSGLEQAIADRIVCPDTLQSWLATLMQEGSGRVDAILIREAAQAVDPTSVDIMARTVCSSRERLLEQDALGAAFCAQLRATWQIDVPDLTYPVALGTAVQHLGLPVDLAVQMYLQAWIGNLVAASQRLMPLGQTRGQAILAALTPLCTKIAAETTDATLDDITNQTFAADIAAMRHETQSPRIFRT